MTREEAKTLIGENATEEQITALLNTFHNSEKALKEQIANKDKELSKYSDYETIKSKLTAIEEANLTEQQKLEKEKKEIAKNLKDSRIIKNKSKVLTILAGLDLDDEIINSLVDEDETSSISKATKLKTKLDTLKVDVENKTKQNLVQADITPDMSNADLSKKNETMTWEKFTSLPQEEQNRFATEHPKEFENL